MNVVSQKIFLLFQAMVLLLLGMASASAAPGSQQEEKENARATRQQIMQELEALRNERRARRQLEQNPNREIQRSNGGNGQADPSPENGSAPEPQRKASRMSPEERRNLRRQINEAGQDIYLNQPKH